MTTHRVTTWNGVVRVLKQYSPRTVVEIPKGGLPHPRAAGLSRSIGLPEGQSSDYRALLRGGAGLHVKDFGTHYEAHIDEVHPDVDAIEHLRVDAPGVFVAGGVALGAVVARSLGASRDATVVGGVLGGLLAALVATRDDGE